MYRVLARKYRPAVLDEIIGQDSIVQIIKNAIMHDRIAHAYIFSGTRGVGKTSIARILAKSINCINGPTVSPCGVCEACISIQNGNAVDVLEIDGASNTGVDAVRDLKENIIYTPQSFKYKIYIIDEVHMLSNSAFNALLKTLEEPPSHAKFIFATTELHKVPETILSRCQRFNFKRIPANAIYLKLKDIAEKEDIRITAENLMTIASLADGSIRDSLSTFDTVISYYGNDIAEDISHILGLTLKKTISELADAIFRKNYEKSIRIIRDIYESGVDTRQFIKQLAFYFRNILVIKLKYKDLINDLTDEEINSLIPIAEQKTEEELLDTIDILLSSEVKYQKISHPLLSLEIIVFRLINIPNKQNIAELLKKIDALNGRKITSISTSINDKQPSIIENSIKDKNEFEHEKIKASSRDSEKSKEMDIKEKDGAIGQLNDLMRHFNSVDKKNSKEPISKSSSSPIEKANYPVKDSNDDFDIKDGNPILDHIKNVFKDNIERIDIIEKTSEY